MNMSVMSNVFINANFTQSSQLQKHKNGNNNIKNWMQHEMKMRFTTRATGRTNWSNINTDNTIQSRRSQLFHFQFTELDSVNLILIRSQTEKVAFYHIVGDVTCSVLAR